jgi:hypothetical protein
MFDFYKEWDKAYQKAQDVVEAVKQGNEFWVNHYIASIKELFNTTKTK